MSVLKVYLIYLSSCLFILDWKNNSNKIVEYINAIIINSNNHFIYYF